jgi:phosphomannomutase
MTLGDILRQRVTSWIADEVNDSDASQLQDLLEAAQRPGATGDSATAELADRFSGPLTFGTAGLRGPLRAGPNGMNTAVVRRAAAGLASYLRRSGASGGVVAIGYDGRHASQSFAEDSAKILAAAGFQPRLMPRPLPTPVLAFAVGYLRAVAGVMVTASHNPPQDNGYKVYSEDGAQIIPPMDADISAAIEGLASVRGIALGQLDTDVRLDDSLIDAYVAAVAGLVDADSPRELRIVHTAMHGVGTEVLRRVFTAAGFELPESVAEQALPDPDFPTVAFPNPEEPGAMDLALALADRHDADIVIANDPDADRCAVAVSIARVGRGSTRLRRMLTGDEVGILLADWLLSHGVSGTYTTTIVSSTMLKAMAERHGVGFAETLTGFKWISRAAPDLVYGYEEALGYAVAPSLVRDKDGISAALLVAEMAASLKAEGSSMLQRLDELAAEYGRYVTRQLSWRVSDTDEIAGAMQRLRADPPAILLSTAVQLTDLAPENDVLILRFRRGRVVIRPSGTEPKCKAYLEVVVPPFDPGDATALLDALAEQVREAVPLP